MNFWDTINPWGALRRKQAELDNYHAWVRGEIESYKDGLLIVQQRADELEAQLITAKDEILLYKIRHDKLQRTIARGHFRNPETGRIGPKGVTYE